MPPGAPLLYVATLVADVAISFEEARSVVLREVRALGSINQVSTEQVPLGDAAGRVLAEDIAADRDYPPFHRSARDGFAVRAADVPGTLTVVGEIRAGEIPRTAVDAGQAIEIMTGAPMPVGADAVVMVEHTRRDGNFVIIERSIVVGDNFTPQGTEAARDCVVLPRGRRIGYPEIALLAMVGRSCVPVFRQPRVAILPTGDEIVDIDTTPGEFQIRNSNAWSLAAQVRRAGGMAEVLPIARDDRESTRALIEHGFANADLLLLSGGVSAGKYDIVEIVLSELGAKFFFDRVAIQPGQPVVFGTARDKYFFGLPGNPLRPW